MLQGLLCFAVTLAQFEMHSEGNHNVERVGETVVILVSVFIARAFGELGIRCENAFEGTG